MHGKAIVIGAGWHPALFREEAQILVDGEFEIIHSHALAMSDVDAEFLASRSSLVSEILSPGDITSLGDLHAVARQIATAFLSLEFSVQRIAVRAERTGEKPSGWSSREIAGLIGGHLVDAGWPIDLTNPEMTLRIHLLAPSKSKSYPTEISIHPVVAWGITTHEGDNWSERTAPNRPFFKPISLDLKLARAMVNLACPKSGNLLDPFCGTGGLLVESLICGIDSFGSDLAWPMVTGTRENVEWIREQIGNQALSEIRNGSALELVEAWNDIAPFTSFVFDPPYGRNAWKSEDGFDLLKGALHSCAEVATSSARLVTLIPWSPEMIGKPLDQGISFGFAWSEIENAFIKSGWSINTTYTIRVHRSLARLLVVASRE